MLLQELLYTTAIRAVHGSTGIEVSGIATDSRQVLPGYAFIALKGVTADGHGFINTAVDKGAIVIIVNIMPAEIADGVTYIEVADTAEAVSTVAANFYGRPSEKLKIVGVTGTNGKTTVSTLLYKLFTSLGYNCGLLGTIENKIGDTVIPASHTTPDPVHLQHLLYQMVKAGCSYVFMEVSSHAIHQQRIGNIQFAGGVFTNITHDHLDYHKTFDEYIRIKKMFFDALPKEAFALTNADDKRGHIMLQNTAARKYNYALKSPAHFKGKIIENSLTGLVMTVNDTEVHFRLIGTFNAYNLLATFGAAVSLHQDKQEVLQQLSALTGAEGRFEYTVSAKEKILAIIDYAHTPDALENVLQTIHKLRQGYEQVITVVGCGGDRDKTKRPVMAAVAGELSDKIIFTSDNPRTEDALQIIQDMEKGLTVAGKKKHISIADRKEAIKVAINLSNPGDIVLVAGKGHEKYQEINGEKFHFDDKEIVQEIFELLDK